MMNRWVWCLVGFEGNSKRGQEERAIFLLNTLGTSIRSTEYRILYEYLYPLSKFTSGISQALSPDLQSSLRYSPSTVILHTLVLALGLSRYYLKPTDPAQGINSSSSFPPQSTPLSNQRATALTAKTALHVSTYNEPQNCTYYSSQLLTLVP